jgi:cell division protein ZapA (FtsZ GTPase activity inhibitor)
MKIKIAKGIGKKKETAIIEVVAVAIAMLVALGSVSPVIAQEADISEIVGEIDKNMDELKEATETIHNQTDVILGVEGMPDEVKDIAETVHLSSHGLEFFGVYMDKLRKMSIDTEDASEFVTAMELPVMGHSPHDLVHVLIEDPDVKASPEAKSAVDAIHTALHEFIDAAKAMRLNLEDLEYTLAEPPVIADISAPVEGIDKDMDELKEATETIHSQTDVILGVEGMPDEVKDIAETVHLSSHGLEFFGVYMDN